MLRFTLFVLGGVLTMAVLIGMGFIVGGYLAWAIDGLVASGLSRDLSFFIALSSLGVFLGAVMWFVTKGEFISDR